MMEEKEYRKLVDQVFKRIGRAFDDVDPDIAEYEYSQGAVTILFENGSRCILSTQPSVRQIWLAVAAKGVAHHFNYDEKAFSWIDDKGKGLELLAYLKTVVKDSASLDLKL